MGIKCRCGKFAQVNMGMEWVCWDCRAQDLRGTHDEDWRDYELRKKAKELKMFKQNTEIDEDFKTRSRNLFRVLSKSLGEKCANHSGQQKTTAPGTQT